MQHSPSRCEVIVSRQWTKKRPKTRRVGNGYPQSRYTRLLFHRHVDLQFWFRSLTHCFQRVEDISDTFFIYCTFFGNIRNTIAVAKHGCNGAGHGLWDDGGRSRWCGWHGNSPGCSYSFSCWMGLGKKRTAFTILRARQGLLRGTCTKLHAKWPPDSLQQGSNRKTNIKVLQLSEARGRHKASCPSQSTSHSCKHCCWQSADLPQTFLMGAIWFSRLLVVSLVRESDTPKWPKH